METKLTAVANSASRCRQYHHFNGAERAGRTMGRRTSQEKCLQNLFSPGRKLGLLTYGSPEPQRNASLWRIKSEN